MGMHASSFPRTLRAGDPYVVDSSTPGRLRAIVRTVSKSVVFRAIPRSRHPPFSDEMDCVISFTDKRACLGMVMSSLLQASSDIEHRECALLGKDIPLLVCRENRGEQGHNPGRV